MDHFIHFLLHIIPDYLDFEDLVSLSRINKKIYKRLSKIIMENPKYIPNYFEYDKLVVLLENGKGMSKEVREDILARPKYLYGNFMEEIVPRMVMEGMTSPNFDGVYSFYHEINGVYLGELPDKEHTYFIDYSHVDVCSLNDLERYLIYDLADMFDLSSVVLRNKNGFKGGRKFKIAIAIDITCDLCENGRLDHPNHVDRFDGEIILNMYVSGMNASVKVLK